MSAGQGARLRPLTLERPKCLVEVAGATILQRQLEALQLAGVAEVVVVTGFGERLVEQALAARSACDMKLTSLFNPFYQVAENLGSAWLAREFFLGGGLLLNGDTLVGPDMISLLFQRSRYPVTLCSDLKSSYDEDDMKLALDGDCVLAIGKGLTPSETKAESVGLSLLSPAGGEHFVTELEAAVRGPGGVGEFYLSAFDRLARQGLVGHVPICGHAWCEIDFPGDVEAAETMLNEAAGLKSA